MIINASDIDIPAEVWIYYAIPKEVRDHYKVLPKQGHLVVNFKSEKVAMVLPLDDGSFEFIFLGFAASLKFKEIMEAAQLIKNSTDLYWMVLVSSDKTWQCVGVPDKTRLGALNMIDSGQDRALMVIVSFVYSEVADTKVVVRSANYVTYVDGKLEVDNNNMGAIAFQVTSFG